jgi:hypothetical protein
MRMTGAIAIALLALLLTWNCLASDDIELYVIGFDITKGSPEEANLKNMTAQMGGNYLSAENASSSAELESAFTRSYTGDVNITSSTQALRQKLAGDWVMEGAATGVQNSDWKAVLSLSQDGTLGWRETEGATPGVTRTGSWDFDGTTIILKWAAPKGGQTAWVSTSVKDNSIEDGAYTAEKAPPGTWSAARSNSSGISQMGRIQGDWIMKGRAGGVQNSDFTASLTLSPNGNLSWEETKGEAPQSEPPGPEPGASMGPP